MLLCWLNNVLGAYSEDYSDSAAGRCQKLQTVGGTNLCLCHDENIGAVDFEVWEV